MFNKFLVCLILTEIKVRVDECISVLQKSKSAKEKKDAVKELCDLGLNAEAALEELMKIINGRKDFILQGLAEETVIMIGEPAIPALKKLLKSFQRKKRSRGLELLGEIALNDKEVIKKILPIIKPIARYDLSYKVRLDAVSIIGKFVKKNKALNAIKLLGKVLRKDQNQLVIREASKALAEADDKFAVKEILKSMDRKSYPFPLLGRIGQYEAASALYLIVSENPNIIKESVPFLLKILKEDPNTSLRILVLLPIITAGGWDIMEELLVIIVKDRQWRVRMSALETSTLLWHQKPSEKHLDTLIPIIKKIAREDKYELVQDSAKALLEEIEESLREED